MPFAVISICLATYNGNRYIEAQLRSILEQLSPEDEVLVADDGSTDNTIALINAMGDPRIRWVAQGGKLGVVKNFERSISSAKGEFIFLSDQDDLWLAGKVDKIIAAFLLNPEVTLVASDAKVIDVSGSVVADSFFEQRGHFAAGLLHNLIKNKYLGCTLAFRRSMLEHFLPIPRDVPMHDMWFGLVNDIYGKTHYIDQPLIAYRRHGNNVSPSEGAPIMQKLVWRWRLVRNLLLRCLQYSWSRRRDHES